MTYKDAKQALHSFANGKHAEFHSGFFKTGPGQYGEGDIFLGARVPQVRQVAKRFRSLQIPVLKRFLHSAIHEERLMALIIMTEQYKRADEATKEELVEFYLANTAHVNNWDLVDSSAHKILGQHLLTRPRKILDTLSRSESLWERRIAMIATMPFVSNGEYKDTLKLAKRYLKDPEDLMHKATGWLLREVGKQDNEVLLIFLDQHYPKMPRTMLRYSIEKLPERTRQQYLKGTR